MQQFRPKRLQSAEEAEAVDLLLPDVPSGPPPTTVARARARAPITAQLLNFYNSDIPKVPTALPVGIPSTYTIHQPVTATAVYQNTYPVAVASALPNASAAATASNRDVLLANEPKLAEAAQLAADQAEDEARMLEPSAPPLHDVHTAPYFLPDPNGPLLNTQRKKLLFSSLKKSIVKPLKRIGWWMLNSSNSDSATAPASAPPSAPPSAQDEQEDMAFAIGDAAAAAAIPAEVFVMSREESVRHSFNMLHRDIQEKIRVELDFSNQNLNNQEMILAFISDILEFTRHDWNRINHYTTNYSYILDKFLKENWNHFTLDEISQTLHNFIRFGLLPDYLQEILLKKAFNSRPPKDQELLLNNVDLFMRLSKPQREDLLNNDIWSMTIEEQGFMLATAFGERRLGGAYRYKKFNKRKTRKYKKRTRKYKKRTRKYKNTLKNDK